MFALTLQQPWATLVALGINRIETRSWATAYRGHLLIHASRRLGIPNWSKKFQQYILKELGARGYHSFADLPRGAIVGSVNLHGCLSTADVKDHPCLSSVEAYLGKFQSGNYAWILKNPRHWSKPIPAHGRTGLWRWTKRWRYQAPAGMPCVRCRHLISVTGEW